MEVFEKYKVLSNYREVLEPDRYRNMMKKVLGLINALFPWMFPRSLKTF